MSKARYPYDNAPMERYFNTLKNECINLYGFQIEEEMYQTMEEFAYVIYNHVHPRSYNGYRTRTRRGRQHRKKRELIH